MFTGIIEEIGSITGIQRSARSLRLTIKGNKIFSDLQIGDSVSVNGVCLTATTINGNQFTADVMPESVKMTTLPQLQLGSHVNLERAMLANGRFGGHMVAGHVDGTGTITHIEKNDISVIFTIAAEPSIMEYIIYKGSIAINGTSLTVSKRTNTSFQVSIIPHTLQETILAEAHVGTVVNLETDIAGRYIKHFMRLSQELPNERKNDMKDLLMKNGFI